MPIWTQPISCEILARLHEGTAVQHLGIEFLDVGEDSITARVPVDTRTKQPYGLLHGGVSVVLAETLGSCGAAFSCPPGHRAVGLGHRCHPAGAHRPQHPGLADRPAQRRRRAQLRLAHHHGGAGATLSTPPGADTRANPEPCSSGLLPPAEPCANNRSSEPPLRRRTWARNC